MVPGNGWSRWLDRKKIRFFLVPVLTAGLVCAALFSGALEKLERLTLDFRLRTFSSGIAAPVAFCALDRDSIKELGEWPLQRDLYAQAMERILVDGARMILVDIDFSSRSPEPYLDTKLTEFIDSSSGIVLAVQMEEKRTPEGALITNLALPIRPLFEAASDLGSITFEVDEDGVIRGMPGSIDFIDDLFLPLGMVGARDRDPSVPLTLPDGALIALSKRNLGSYPNISFARVLRGEFPPGTFRDRYVFIGSTATDLHDFWLTPIGIIPGIYIQAAVLETALNRSWSVRQPSWAAAVLLTVFSLLIAPLMGRGGWKRGTLVLLGCLVLIVVASAVFALKGLMIHSVGFIAVALLQFPILVTLYARETEKNLALQKLKTGTILKFSELRTAEEAGQDSHIVPLVLLQQVIGLDRVLLYLSEGEGSKGWQVETVIGDDVGEKAGNHEIIEEVAAKGTVVLEASERKDKSVVYVPMSTSKKNMGVLYAEGPGKVLEDNDNIRLLLSHATQTAYFLEVHELDRQVRSLYNNTIKAILKALGSKDIYTSAHSELSQQYVEKFGRKCGLNAVMIEALHIGALLHDIGKIGVPDRILNKAGKLTEEEFKIIKKHPDEGFEIIKDLPLPHDVKMIVKHHHEYFDGSGYPDGLEGDHIPMLVRIFSVLDTYEAMVGQRPYKRPIDPEKAKNIILESAGTQFDPQIVKIFLSIF